MLQINSKEVTGGADEGVAKGRRMNKDEEEKGKEEKQRMRCKWGHSGAGCLWWMRKMQREEKNKPRN